jgi:hypothetical protein
MEVTMALRLCPRASVLALVIGWSVGAGCGGRSLSTHLPDGGGAGQATGTAGDLGAAGTTGAAGAAGVAGTTGAAGITGGAGVNGQGGAGVNGQGGAGVNGQGGAGGQGGVPGCLDPCPTIGCNDGFMSVLDPSVSCCPICKPIDCATVDCVNPNCPTGYHTEVPTGQCCPVCFRGLTAACTKAEQAYADSRASLLMKYSEAGCNVDADCKLVFEANNCVSSCGTALALTEASFFTDNIDSETQACDMSCPPIVSAPCAPLTVAVCSNGLCTAVPAPVR